MKKLKLVLCLLYLVNLSYSQEEKKALNAGWNMNPKKIIEANKNAIFVINGTILNEFVMEKIASINIDSIQVLKSENSVLKYGEIGKNGAILICTKNISKPDLKNLYKLYPFTLNQNTNQKAKKISGTVTDCESIPLQNIMVENLNSKINTSTDSLGKYTLEVRKNDIISFTNKSYKTERIQYQKQKNITISLKEKPISDKIMVKKPVIY